MERICTGCAVLLREDSPTSFCCKECQWEFELSEAYAGMVYRELDKLVNDGVAPILGMD